jgi:hypothetical protein
MEKKNCYNFKKIIFNDGFLNNSVDATYIIHLEGNGRLSDIQKQLNEYHPTNIVYILFNKGYKKCYKNENIKNSAHDLIDAFLEIFKDANKKNYENILILEDDFIFSPKIKNSLHLKNINHFLYKNKENNFIYLLGAIPGLQIPFDYYNNIIYSSLGMHAVIYSKKNRDETLNYSISHNITDWDIYNNFRFNRYIYYIPLCYQLFPDTENKKNWGINQGILLINASKILKKIFNFLNLDKKYEPGYTYFYYFSKILFYLLLILLCFIIYKIYKICNKKSKR